MTADGWWAHVAISSADRPSGRLTKVSSLQAHLFALPDVQDRPYSEALFTTFNVDLGYFEQRLLGLVRASGAEVTILADGSQYEPDPLAVHAAGSNYLVGVVDQAAAFHPKVSVLVGAERVLVAVGSGNLTTGGWLGNDETLFVATGSRDTGIPAIAGEVSVWLASLENLRTGDLALQAIDRVRQAIDRLVAAGPVVDTGHQLVTTSGGPILDQLPGEPVDELFLHAPFHDHSGSALDALLDRYTPGRVNIAVQDRKRTILDPQVLARVASSRGVELVWHDAGKAYRHGKLIEAVTGSARWVLTGSANLTGAALLRGRDSGGNCEVGVVTAAEQSLYPGEGQPLETTDIPVAKILTAPGEGPARSGPVPVLLGATLDGGAVVVELARPAPAPVGIEVSEYQELPEIATVLGHVPAGASHAHLVPDRPLGARSRLRLRYDHDGVTYRGPVHFLTDPEAVQRRMPSRRSASSNSDVDWRTLFGDLTLLDAWKRTLDKVTREQRVVPASAVRTLAATSVSSAGTGVRRTFDEEEAWAQYSQDAVARLGPTLAHDASGGLILPHLTSPAGTSVSVTRPVWADKFDADDADFDDEHTADELDGADDVKDDESGSPADLVTQQQKQRFRGWIKTLTTELGARPALDRLALTRLVLIASLAPVWEDDAAWFSDLHNATTGLVNDDVPAPLEAELASLASVCVFRLDQGASPDRRTGSGRQYAELLELLRTTLSRAEPERIDTIIRAVYGTSAMSPSTQAVLDHLGAVTQADPWPEIARLIQREHGDWEVDLETAGVLMIEARSGAPFKVAAEALELVPRDLTIGITVYAGKRLERRRYARHDNVLVVEDFLGSRRAWKTYRLSALVSPTGIQASASTERSARIDQPPWRAISATARTMLEAVGFDDDE